MTSELIARVKASYEHVSRDARALSSRFYEQLFLAAPALPPLHGAAVETAICAERLALEC
jgi:hypothetical protein